MIERERLVPGQPPSTVWSAFQLPHSDEYVIALVGLTESVEKLIKRLGKPFRRPKLDLPVVSCVVQGGIRLSILFVGKWPAQETAHFIVREIAGAFEAGPREWESNLRKLYKRDPLRFFNSTSRVDEEVVRSLISAYMYECRLAAQLTQPTGMRN